MKALELSMNVKRLWGFREKRSGIFTGHEPTRGSGQDVLFKYPGSTRLGSRGVLNLKG